MRPLTRPLMRPLQLALLGLALSAPPALAQTDLGNLSDAERAAFRAEVRAYLIENPEVIFEAIQILEERREEMAAVTDRETVQANSEALFEDGYSFVGGNPDGDVTMVEFLDYRCGFCKRAHPEIKQVLEQDPNVRLVVKEFPILGPESVAAGRMAMAAVEIDAALYPALSDALIGHQGPLTEAAAYRIAADVGYEIEALKTLAGTPEIEAQIEQNYALAETLGIQGTPSFVVGDELVRGYLPADELLAAIAAQRENASN